MEIRTVGTHLRSCKNQWRDGPASNWVFAVYGTGPLTGPSGALISVASYVGVKIRFEGGWRHPKQQFWHCAAAGFENKLVEDSFWT